jgi:hypothetical protein
MNRKTTRLFLLAALVTTAGLAACKSGEAKSAPSNATGGVGAGPYTEWQPITPPSKQAK